MDYRNFFAASLESLRVSGRYRSFNVIERYCGDFPRAYWRGSSHDSERQLSSPKDIVVWCSNDYLGMGQHGAVLAAQHRALDECGSGAGGTRNISGSHRYIVDLESVLAHHHGKESSLVFTSGYVANWTVLQTLGRHLEGCVILSDSENHNSMIEGIRASGADKLIFAHNDVVDLRNKLASLPSDCPKIVAFESLYSMDGDIAPVEEIVSLAEEFGALSYCDEVHAVGLYGESGGGICEREGIAHRVDILQGTLGKAFGLIGGYIASSFELCDFVRCYGSGFIFTTALPPVIAAGAIASVGEVRKSHDLRLLLASKAELLKSSLRSVGIPMLPSSSHIVPVLVGDAIACKSLSDALLDEFNFYAQAINYPTVSQGSERLRFTPSPLHSDDSIGSLVEALDILWTRLSLERVQG